MIGRWTRAALAAALVLLAGAADARTVRWAASGDPNTMDPHSQNVGTGSARPSALAQNRFTPGGSTGSIANRIIGRWTSGRARLRIASVNIVAKPRKASRPR